MRPRTLLRILVASGLAVGAPATAAAQADTVIAPDSTAQNVTTYGSTSAWSRKAPDGTYRLVIRAGATIADAQVAPSPVPFDPDLGPTKTNGRVVVYSRCAGTSATSGCDVYSYDVKAGVESKVAAVSGRHTSETAPSFYKGAIAFSRAGGSKPGLYLYRPGKGLKRISTKSAAETDVGETRVVSLYHPGGPSGGETFVRLSNFTGADQRTVARATINGAGEGDRLTSPTLSRFNAFWLRVTPLNETTVVQRTGVNPHRGLSVLTASRTFTGELGALSVTNVPVLYTGPAGVSAIDPGLVFPPAMDDGSMNSGY
jgi:hypothetical protein